MANKRTGAAGRSTKAVERPKRVPVAQQDKMKYDKREGFQRRLVNDINDGQNVQRYLDGGWVKATQPNQDLREDSMGESQLGTEVRRSVGNGVQAVLMEIPQKIYDSDQKLKKQRIDDNERGMARDKNEGVNESTGQYGEVVIKH